jgi:hypothetical protein
MKNWGFREGGIMKRYAIKSRFIFEGYFFIHAENKAQAAEYVEQHCGLFMGGSIHTTLPDEAVDWDFPIHPETVIGRVKHETGEKL